MRRESSHSPVQLSCGCYRYCDNDEHEPSGSDLEFSRSLAERFGEAWFDLSYWQAGEFSMVCLSQGRMPRGGPVTAEG